MPFPICAGISLGATCSSGAATATGKKPHIRQPVPF